MGRTHPDSSFHFQAIHHVPIYPRSVAAFASSLCSKNPSRPVETEPDAQQNGKAEAVPIEFVYANPPNRANSKEASSHIEVPIYKKNQVGITLTVVEHARQSSPEMAKTKLKSRSDEALVFVSYQGRGQLRQLEVLNSKDHGRAVEPGASAAAAVEKAKSATETASPSKPALGQTTGARKVESFALVLTHEEKVKPKPEKVPTTETSGGQRNAPRDQSREAKEKGDDINIRVSDYIRRTRSRIMSNAGGAEGGGQQDGGTDHFGNYIQ